VPIGQRAAEDLDDLRLAERTQHVHAAAREQRAVYFERRILGGGADQYDRALLDVRQEGVLPGAIEAVELVEEEDGAPAALSSLGLGLSDDLTDLLDAGQHGGERHEARPGDVRHERRERRLARPGWTPEDHRMELAALECSAQHATRTEQ